MSDRLAPSRPTTQAPSTWKEGIFRVRGWTSNAAKNQGLKGSLDAVLKPGGPDSAAALEKEKLEAGPEFKAYLKCLVAFETAPDANKAAALAAAAQGYITHFDNHSSKEKKQKATVRKAQVCQKTLTEVQCWSTIQSIGGPPWNSKVAMKAATIKAELDFASLPLGGQTAQTLDGKGVNPTFWVNRAGTDPAKPDKTYLFKPATNKTDRAGVPPGGEPAREALTGRAADILNGMMGIDFKVPETHIVSVERKRFEDIELADVVVDRDGKGPLVGSLQQFAKSKGELRDNSPALARAVPAERCQELAILDIVTMHIDRHGGNFMIDGVDTGADLVPIDNGLSFPDVPTELCYMAATHNALLRLPGSHKPFTPEMLAKIARINPAALKKALKSEIGDIEAVHPSAAGKITDAALEQSRRSAMFLKLAAPTLTPAAVQVALGQNADWLFDTVAITDDAAFAVLAGQIIDKVDKQQPALAEYFQMSSMEQIQVEDACRDLGWDTDALSVLQMMAVFKSKAPQPAAPRPAFGGEPPTDQEKRDMLLAFPRRKVDQEWYRLNTHLWRARAPFGDARAIKAAVQSAAANISNPSMKGSVLANLGTALDVLNAQKMADAIPPGSPAAGKALVLDGKRDLIKKLAKTLGPLQAQISQAADTLRAAGNSDGLDALRDKVSGLVRNLLLDQLPGVREKINGIPDGSIKSAALVSLTDGEKQIRDEMNLLRGKELIDQAKLRTGIGSI